MRIECENFQLLVLLDAFVELISGKASRLGTSKRLSDVYDGCSWLCRDEILDLTVDQICWSSFCSSKFRLKSAKKKLSYRDLDLPLMESLDISISRIAS